MADPIKICIGGRNATDHNGTGKTQLVNRLLHDQFDDAYRTTIGADFKTMNVSTTNSTKLQIWDTAGAERYMPLFTMYTRGSQVILYCVDLSAEVTNVELIAQEIRENQPIIKGPIILVGTKCDDAEHTDIYLQRLAAIRAEVGDPPYIITSAKTGYGITKSAITSDDTEQTLIDFMMSKLLVLVVEAEAEAIHASPAFLTLQSTLQTYVSANKLQEVGRLLQKYNVDKNFTAFSMACHAALEGEHPNVVNAFYALAAGIVVGALVASLGFAFGIAATTILITSLTSGAVSGGLTAWGLFKNTQHITNACNVFTHDSFIPNTLS